MSHSDFGDARKFIDAAKAHDESSTEYEALLLAAIICYARPFTNNEGRIDNPAVAQKVLIDTVAALDADLPLHNELLRMRNKAVAHAESSHYPTGIVSRNPPGAAGIIFSSRRWHVLNERIDLEAFRRVAQSMRTACANRMLYLNNMAPSAGHQ